MNLTGLKKILFGTLVISLGFGLLSTARAEQSHQELPISCHRLITTAGVSAEKTVGDLDGDAVITENDIIKIYKIVSDHQYDYRADINGDQFVTGMDALLARRLLSGDFKGVAEGIFNEPLSCLPRNKRDGNLVAQHLVFK